MVVDVAVAGVAVSPHRGKHCEAMLICEVAFFGAQQLCQVQAVRVSTVEVQPKRNVAVCHYLFRNKSCDYACYASKAKWNNGEDGGLVWNSFCTQHQPVC